MFRGWFVVAAAFAITFLGFGAAYAFSAFLESLEREFSASRGSVSLVFSLAGFLYFGLGIVTGPAADRWGARRLAVIGMALTGGAGARRRRAHPGRGLRRLRARRAASIAVNLIAAAIVSAIDGPATSSKGTSS